MDATKSKVVRRHSPVRRSLKSVEQFFKRSVLAVLTRLAAPRVQDAPDWHHRKVRVLFLRHDKIGDMILSTAIIRAIAQSHPNIELDVLASPANAPVLEKDPLVHRVVPFNVRRFQDCWRLLRYLRGARYDIVVDCMVFSQSLTTLLLMLATRAPHRVGILKEGKPNFYTMPAQPPRASAHHVEHLAQLALPFGVAAQDALQLKIVMEESERTTAMDQWDAGDRRRVLVNISAGKAFRQWPDRNYVAVIKEIKARMPDARMLLLHAPAERERAQAIADAAGLTRATTPSLRHALALVATADFVFTPDTSILHAASAFRIPTVTMLTSDHFVRWGLYGAVGEAVVAPGDTLANASLPDVIKAIRKALPLLATLGDTSQRDNFTYQNSQESPA